MSFVAWDDRFTSGIRIFDDEHKALIAIVNQLHDAFMSGVERAALSRICDELTEYVMLHFRHEEMYFDDWHYPDKQAHIAAHRQLREQVFAYRGQILDRPSLEMANELFGFLRLWLTEHILSDDRYFCEFLYQKGLR